MKCSFCVKTVGSTEHTRVEVWVFPSPGGPAEKVFGPVPGADGPLGTSCWNLGGTFSRAYHRKCFLAERRRRQLRSADASAQPPGPSD